MRCIILKIATIAGGWVIYNVISIKYIGFCRKSPYFNFYPCVFIIIINFLILIKLFKSYIYNKIKHYFITLNSGYLAVIFKFIL